MAGQMMGEKNGTLTGHLEEGGKGWRFEKE